MLKSSKSALLLGAVALLAACKTSSDTAAMSDGGASGSGTTAAGSTAPDTGSGGTTTGAGGTGTGIPALVNVNLQDVLNDLSVKLNIDRANIPVNAQVPIDVAANVCGVSVSVLSVSTGGQASCTAKTASTALVQTVQQQVAAGGNVGGGSQTTSPPTGNQM